MTQIKMSDSPSILKVAAVGTLIVVLILLGLRFFYPPGDPQVIDDLVVETLTRLDTVNEIIINTGSDIITNVESRQFTRPEGNPLYDMDKNITRRSFEIEYQHKWLQEKAWDMIEKIHQLFVTVRSSWGKGPESGYNIGE